MAIKRKRLPGGRWVSYKVSERQSDPAELAKAQPHEVWYQGEERGLILIRDMDTQHLLNVKRILEERAKGLKTAIGAEATIEEIAARSNPVYKTVLAVLKDRLEGKPPPDGRNRLIDLED